jgi:hypothetical protein
MIHTLLVMTAHKHDVTLTELENTWNKLITSLVQIT